MRSSFKTVDCIVIRSPDGSGSWSIVEPAGMTNRAIVIFGPDGVVRWSYVADSPGDLPGVNLILDALDS